MRLSVAFLCLSLFGFVPSALGQSASATSVPSVKLEVKAYRTLFRRDLMLKQMADDADSTKEPKSYLRKVLRNRFSLSEADSASLDRLAVNYQQEINPIEQKMVSVIQKFRAQFPGGFIPRDVTPSPPSELTGLQQEEDAIVLRYRDQLRNSMREDDFQKLHAQVLKSFAAEVAQ